MATVFGAHNGLTGLLRESSEKKTVCRPRMLNALAVLAVILVQSARLHAQGASPELPTEPILRIETGKHGDFISRTGTDAANRFAVTASQDKTVRVWSLPDGHLQRILRLPIDQGNIGKAYAVTISPDASTVAVGGVTGPPGRHNIFLFDRASGALKRCLCGDLPSAVFHLAYSPDGQRLAASLSAQSGIRVFDASGGYRPLPSDTQYGASSYWVDFDHSGRLVTTSYDGLVRLYAADHYAKPVAQFDSQGDGPYSAVFSPDGSRVAVGFRDNTEVTVLSGRDLKELFRIHSTDVPNGGLDVVAWSADAQYLFAGGVRDPKDLARIRRWSKGGRGGSVNIPAEPDTIMSLLGLTDGRMLFSSSRSFGLIRSDAKAISLQELGVLKLNSGRGPLRISPNGDIVQFDSLEPNHTYRFALGRRQVDLDPATDTSLMAPATQAPGLSVTNWHNSTGPMVNGASVKLETREISRSLAIVPDTEHFVLGASWWLRLLDRAGHEIWPARPIPGEAWHVNVSADGRLIVGAFNDGTIRWYRVSDGEELLALFIHPDGQRWILWTPQGYYDASVGADELIGWHVNHGYDRAPDFYPVSQFRGRFLRPDVIQRVLTTPKLDITEAVREADQAAGQPTTRAAPVSSLLTPVIEIDDPKDPVREDHTDLQLGYSVRLPSVNDTLRVEAQVDGVKVAADDRRLIDKGDTRAGILHIKIPRRDFESFGSRIQ